VEPFYQVASRHRGLKIGGKECSGGGIIELTSVVTLDGFDGAAKLCKNKGDFF
jgi:hypothetical protein